ncbi:ABC-2 type transporter [uncultured Desulfatiglans sp.]|nr:ABC-2 type transporter [uncultured Desulfatiglans sp.]
MTRQIGAVMRKELAVTFTSPIFYAVAFIFLLISGYFFYSDVAYFNFLSLQAASNPFIVEGLNPETMVIQPFFGNISIILLLMLPLLTMRLYAEEKKTGTIELLFTYPLSDVATLTGKVLATFTALLALLAAGFPCFLLFSTVSFVDWGMVGAGYLGLLLMGGAFVSLGVFTSSLTENQVVAAALSFGLLLLFWALGWAEPLVGGRAGRVLAHLAIASHMDSFAQGLLDTRDVLYYLCFGFFWLFLTLRSLNSRSWRS